jgi:hypothetical protein
MQQVTTANLSDEANLYDRYGFTIFTYLRLHTATREDAQSGHLFASRYQHVVKKQHPARKVRYQSLCPCSASCSPLPPAPSLP